MEKQINLEEILNNQFEPDYDFKLHYGNTTTINILEAMKEAIKQALELAAENATAKIEIEWSGNTGSEYCDEYAVVNKQSILDTIK